MTDLNALALRVEQLEGPDRDGLNNDVARAVGWQRITPSQMGRGKHGGWISPEDYVGRYDSGRPILDSLHGTDIHRNPPPFLTSLDAAMSLVPEGWRVAALAEDAGADPFWGCALGLRDGRFGSGGQRAVAKTAPLALVSAALKARSKSHD